MVTSYITDLPGGRYTVYYGPNPDRVTHREPNITLPEGEFQAMWNTRLPA